MPLIYGGWVGGGVLTPQDPPGLALDDCTLLRDGDVCVTSVGQHSTGMIVIWYNVVIIVWQCLGGQGQGQGQGQRLHST